MSKKRLALDWSIKADVEDFKPKLIQNTKFQIKSAECGIKSCSYQNIGHMGHSRYCSFIKKKECVNRGVAGIAHILLRFSLTRIDFIIYLEACLT
jgi:hypothetical protein